MRLAKWENDSQGSPTLEAKGLKQFSSSWLQFKTNRSEDEFNLAMRMALDERYWICSWMQQPGEAGETIAFQRLLQRAKAAKELLDDFPAEAPNDFQNIPLVDLTLLSSQSDALRGRLIRFRGTVALAEDEPITKSTPFGDFSYHVVWLRPEQTGDIPICFLRPLQRW